MKFKVTIEEHISQQFEVEADDERQAEDFAREKYRSGEIVVDNGSLITTAAVSALNSLGLRFFIVFSSVLFRLYLNYTHYA